MELLGVTLPPLSVISEKRHTAPLGIFGKFSLGSDISPSGGKRI